MKSKNMNYMFNVEYFENAFTGEAAQHIEAGNKSIFTFNFPDAVSPLSVCDSMDGYKSFSLFTLYPGLLVGTGNLHGIAVDGALKCGFTFDYVTGLPYITGSTLKGMIRSSFPGDTKDGELNDEYDTLIKGLLEKENLDVLKLKKDMFEGNDVFLGAFPVVRNGFGKLLDMEFITPHKEFKNPNPISLLKVRPGVEFEFSFVFSDYVEDGEVVVSAEEKKALCKKLILLMGIGAKTNVGFGRFSTERPKMHQRISQPKFQNGNQNYQKGGNQNGRYQKGGYQKGKR